MNIISAFYILINGMFIPNKKYKSEITEKKKSGVHEILIYDWYHSKLVKEG